MTTETLSPIKLTDAGEYSHEDHTVGFGASDSARSLGVSSWGTTLELYLEKTGAIEPFSGNLKTRVGNALEPVVREEFESATGIKVIESPMGLYQSSENPFVLATPDADLETDALGEWKTTSWRMADRLGEEGTDNLPIEWLCQCQQQMYVMGRRMVHVAVLVDAECLLLFRVERNDELIGCIVEAERELWQRIQDLDPPEPEWEHSRTPQLIREMYGIAKEEQTVKHISMRGLQAWHRKRQAGRLINRLKAREEMEAAKVRAEIGKDFAVILPGGEKMIRRKRIIAEVSAHTKDYIDMRECKVPRGLRPPPSVATEIPDLWPDDVFQEIEIIKNRYAEVDSLLSKADYLLKEKSKSGSRYYVILGGDPVRVADHGPNAKTENWMENDNVLSIRIDGDDFNAVSAVNEFLELRKAEA